MIAPVSVFDIEILRGTTMELQLVWTDTANQPIDVTNFESYMQIRNEHTKELILDASNYIYGDFDPLNGVFIVSIPADKTASMRLGKYGFDILVKNDTNTYQIAKGRVYVKDTLTRIP